MSIGDNWCPDCGGEGQEYASRFGGNDPDVWPVGKCEACGGSGIRALYTPSKRRWRGMQKPWPNPQAKVAALLDCAAAARLTIAGKRREYRYMLMPFCRRSILEGWRSDIAAARAARVQVAA